MVFYLEKLESHSCNNALCQVWLKLVLWFWRRVLNFVTVFFSISLLSLRGKWHDLSFESTWIPFTQGGFHFSWLKLAQLFWGRRFLNSVHVFSLIRYYFHFEKDVVLYLIFKHEFSLPKQVRFQPSLVEVGPVILEKISSMYFQYFVIISSWEKARPFIWTNLNLLCPNILCAKFGWN